MLVSKLYGKPTTTSLKVAERFGKIHKNVIRDIREKILPNVSEDFNRLNFELSTYTDPTGRTLPMYNLTRDGFTMLVMGYTGPEAMKFKEQYINAFNQMEQLLCSRAENSREIECFKEIILSSNWKPYMFSLIKVFKFSPVLLKG